MATNDDIVTLGGVNLPITGIVTASAASDFEVGLKVGKVSYDHRENAFFLVFDDFTGGFGSQYLDIREELGTYWFAGSYNSPETAYPGRVTLPLSQEYVHINNPGASRYNINIDVNNPWLERETWYLFGIGTGLFSLASIGAQPVLRSTGAGGSSGIVSVVAGVDSISGQDRVYAAWASGASDAYVSFNDGATWVAQLSRYKKHGLPPLLQGAKGDILASDKLLVRQGRVATEFGTLIQEYANPSTTFYSPLGVEKTQLQPDTRLVIPLFEYNHWNSSGRPDFTSVWQLIAQGTSQASLSPVNDVFFWDYKLLGQFDGSSIAFLVPAEHEALAWLVIPKGEYIYNALYQEIDNAQTGSRINTYANPSTTFYSPLGVEKTQLQPATYIVEPTFTSVFGWAVSSTTEVNEALLLSVNTSHSYYVPGGSGTRKNTNALMRFIDRGEEPWNVFIEDDGHVVAAADIDRELRFVGVMAAPWGEPAVYLRGGNKMYVLDFYSRKLFPIEIGSDKPLIAHVMHEGTAILTDGWSIYEFNPQSMTERDISLPSKWGIPPNLQGVAGPYQIVGLISYDKELLAILVDPDAPATVLYRHNGIGWSQVGARMDDFFATYGFRATFPLTGTEYTNRKQAIIIPGVGDPSDVSGGGEWGYWIFNLPVISHQPTVPLDTFGPSGARMYTGWVDGGFSDIYGTLLRMNTDSFFHNADEKIIIEYRLDNDPTAEESAVWTQMVNVAGVASSFTSSAQSLYFANPTAPKAGIKFRTVQFRITFLRGSDDNSSPELRALTLTYLKTPELRTQWAFTVDINRMLEVKTGEVSTFYVDGAAATLQNIYDKFRALWTNEHTLIPFTVPSATSSAETFYVKIVSMPLSFDDFRAAVAGRGNIQIQVIEPVD